jgi:hypothetical protein
MTSVGRFSEVIKRELQREEIQARPAAGGAHAI